MMSRTRVLSIFIDRCNSDMLEISVGVFPSLSEIEAGRQDRRKEK
jgi:hypothetical protein